MAPALVAVVLAALWVAAPAGVQSGQQAKPTFEEAAARADDLRQAGRLDEASLWYQQALRQKTEWAEGWWYLGTILYDLDSYDEARDAFRRVVNLDPENGPARAFKGLCEFQLKHYDRALDDLQAARALGLSANHELTSVVRYHVGIVLTRMEQYEHALNALTDFAREGNDSTRVIEAFGLATLRMPLLPSELPGHRRELVLMAGRAGFYASARMMVPARRAFEQLAARFPEAPDVNYAYGTFLLTEDEKAALEMLKRELQISPGHVPAMLQIAFEYQKQGNFEAARPYAEEAVQIAPMLFPARKAIGETLLAAGDVTKAIEHLEAGVKLAPDSPGMRFALARAYARAGRPDDAARERAEFLRLDKEFRTQRSGAQSVGGIADLVDRPPNDER